MENWVKVPIEGYGDTYEVSDHGRFRSSDRKVLYSTGVERLHKGRILLPLKHTSGYRLINLYKDKKLKTFLVHRIVAQAFIPNPENLPQVNHKDFDKANNHIDNLEWTSAKENTQHACRAERQFRPYGDFHKSSRLRQEQVDEMRRLYSEGCGQYQLAMKYGIHQSHVSDIVNLKKWKPKSKV